MLTQEQKKELIKNLSEKRGGFIDEFLETALKEIKDKDQLETVARLYVAGAQNYELLVLKELGISEEEYGNIATELGY